MVYIARGKRQNRSAIVVTMIVSQYGNPAVKWMFSINRIIKCVGWFPSSCTTAAATSDTSTSTAGTPTGTAFTTASSLGKLTLSVKSDWSGTWNPWLLSKSVEAPPKLVTLAVKSSVGVDEALKYRGNTRVRPVPGKIDGFNDSSFLMRAPRDRAAELR